MTIQRPSFRSARVAAPARSDPLPGSLKSWHQLNFPVSVGGYTREIGFYEAPLGVRGEGGARAILVDCPDLYDRDALYGTAGSDYPDSPRRFAFLARAALEWVIRAGMTHEMADLLLDDLRRQTKFLESLEAPLPSGRQHEAFAHN